MYTIVVIGCERDLALLELQAQSMAEYLPAGQEIILIINEKDPTNFVKGFEKFSHYYNNFALKIFDRDCFDFVGGQPYVDQQILKLAAATVTNNHLLVLDCQNILCKPYVDLPVFDDKVPYRHAPYAMDETIWKQYCERLGHELPVGLHNMCLSTPIYMHTSVIRNLINTYGGLSKFASWFYIATRSKSEFALYLQWCEKNHGLSHYHYLESDFFDWGGPYLRDHIDFDSVFETYIHQLNERLAYQGHLPSNAIIRHYESKWCWTSINHRAWGDMTDEQFDRLTTVLNGVKLDTNCLINYRKNYVHIPI
jgi:hypothetical protein